MEDRRFAELPSWLRGPVAPWLLKQAPAALG